VTDLAARFAGTRTFVGGLEDALSEFHENIARHVRPWQAPITERMDNETAADASDDFGDDAQSAEQGRKVTKSGMLDGKSFSIFDDGSIEIETESGLQHFKDFAERRAAAAKNGHAELD
jgi:hypothetical protein